MIVDGWLDWAIHAPGIPDKVYTAKNRGIGLVGHSIVGSYQAAINRFMSTERLQNGNYSSYAAASVMFILCKNGDLIQMYDIWSSTWTSGGTLANTSYWAIEAEGGPASNPSEPFTEPQKATLLRLFREWRDYKGMNVERGWTFREHGELAAELGYAPTACPSHRYDWFTRLEDDSMTPAELARLERLEAIVAGNGIYTHLNDPTTLLTGNEALEYAYAQGWSAILAALLANQRIADHETTSHSGGMAGPHHHESGPAVPD